MNISICRVIGSEGEYADWLTMTRNYDPDLTDDRINFAYNKLLLNPAMGLYMAYEGGSNTAIGFMTLCQQEAVFGLNDFMYLSDLYVKPEVRRQGIARRFLHFAYQKAKLEGYERIYWVTEPTNEIRKLYDKVGICEFVRYHKDFK